MIVVCKNAPLSKLEWLAVTLLVAITAIGSYYARQHSIPAEDAVILYEYSKNLAERGVITYGNAEQPIEGATDFLWMVAISILKVFNVDEFQSALVISFLSAGFLAALLKCLGVPRVIGITAIIATPYFYSSINGFSTIAFSAVYLMVLCLAMYREGRNFFYMTLMLLCLIRPDGVVWGIGLIIFRLHYLSIRDYQESDIRSEIKSFLSYLIIPGVVYFVWRAWYFAELLPLPFIVKSAGDRDLGLFFSSSVLNMKFTILPLLLVWFFSRSRKQFATRCLLLMLFPVVFYCAMRLEQNIGNRFLAPMFFGSIAIVALEKRMILLVGFLLASVVLSYPITVGTVRSILQSPNDNIYYIAHELSSIKGKMLATEAGRLAYYSNWEAHDSWGLNTPEFAHHLISRQAISAGNYDLIVAHCDIGMLSLQKLNEDLTVRSWVNQCRNMTAYISENDYKVYLVPYVSNKPKIETIGGYIFTKKSTSCMRHDIYAVSQSYSNAKVVEGILLKYGAVRYIPESDAYIGDRVCF